MVVNVTKNLSEDETPNLVDYRKKLQNEKKNAFL